mmetsp:Transcript_15875/g.47774  ORF Transcript_15875/g.47774 Transcript_15875/m.47774 type:complete len:341 (+) Transcript_15875:434-1456(+)
MAYAHISTASGSRIMAMTSVMSPIPAWGAWGERGAAPEKPSRAAPMEPMVTAMCSHDRKVRSLAKNVFGSMRCGMAVFSSALRDFPFFNHPSSPLLRRAIPPSPVTWSRSGSSCRVGCWPRRGCRSSAALEESSAGLRALRSAATALLLVRAPAASVAVAAPDALEGADMSMDGRTDSSSTQYGTAWTMWGIRVAPPWMNLLNLCTSVRYPLFSSSLIQSGASSPMGRDSLTSSTAWGKRVTSVRGSGSAGSRRHLRVSWQEGPSSGFSLNMVRLVSRLMRTVESNGIWKAVRWYWVRVMGRSCLLSTAFWHSLKNFANVFFSASLRFFLSRSARASSRV